MSAVASLVYKHEKSSIAVECSQKKKHYIAYKILRWYDKNRMSYPWRSGRISPYRILVTEVLLRKTTREQVRHVYQSFFKQFPSARALHMSKNQEVERAITQLGMEKVRVKILKKLAEILVKRYSGRVPLSRNALLSLPGVGEYTANAVLLFAKGEKLPLVDTNSKRIVERVFLGKSFPENRVSDQLSRFVHFLLPDKRYVDFNVALLDFASLVCLPRNPRCHSCTLRTICGYYQTAGSRTIIK